MSSLSKKLNIESDYNSIVLEPALRIIRNRLLRHRPANVADYIYEFYTNIKSEIEAEASASMTGQPCCIPLRLLNMQLPAPLKAMPPLQELLQSASSTRS
jgi:hypothetical protein